MSIIRGPRPERGWTSIANEALRDPQLYWSDRGLLGHLLSLKEGARTDVETLAKVGRDGRDGTRASLRRLQTAGYIRRVQTRGDKGRFITDTYVYDTPAAAAEAIRASGGVDVSAGQDGDGISVTVNPDDPEPAGQDGNGFTVGGQPEGGQPQGGPPLAKYLDLGEEQNQPTSSPPAPTPAEALADAVVGGLVQANRADLAEALIRRNLVAACQAPADCGWSPLMIRAWVTSPAQSWAGVRCGAVIHRLGELGLPPERPRSAVPARQDECPVHPGVITRMATCDACAADSRRVDVSARADEVRAARRPSAGAEPPTSPRGLDLDDIQEGARA